MTDRDEESKAERRALRQVSVQASAAMTAVRRVERTAWLWADNVRSCVEMRGGLGFEDGRVLDDPDYGRALDRCSEIARLTREFEQALQRLQATPAIDMTASPITQQADLEREVER